jgi:hypothetical protein
MVTASSRSLYLAALLALGNILPAAADAIPEPTEALKDYNGRGVLQIDIPPAPVSVGDGTKIVDSGLTVIAEIGQAYVWPDRTRVASQVFGVRQVFLTLANANTEQQWTPGTGFIVRRTYKNLEKDSPSPMMGVQLSMSTYAKWLREVKTAKILPDEDFDKLKAAGEKRIGELRSIRDALRPRESAEDLQRFNNVSSEMARVRDDLNQIELRKKHPCHVVEMENKDLITNLLAHGLMGPRVRDRFEKGKTIFWVTKAHGLPLRMQTTDNEGRVALYFSFLDVAINSGLAPGDLAINAPSNTRILELVADVKQRDWEPRMEEELNELIAKIEQARTNKERPQPPRKSGKGK